MVFSITYPLLGGNPITLILKNMTPRTARSPSRPLSTPPCSGQPWPALPLPLPMTVPHAPLWKQTSAVGVTRLHQRRGGEGQQPGREGLRAYPGSPESLVPAPGPSQPTDRGRTNCRAGGCAAGMSRYWDSSRRGLSPAASIGFRQPAHTAPWVKHTAPTRKRRRSCHSEAAKVLGPGVAVSQRPAPALSWADRSPCSRWSAEA